jgi:mono/diheme cytochrome c family protein
MTPTNVTRQRWFHGAPIVLVLCGCGWSPLGEGRDARGEVEAEVDAADAGSGAMGFFSPPDDRLEGPTVRAGVALPPISGGSLTLLSTSKVLVGDPDRDRLVLVDLVADEVEHEAALDVGSEPGRSVEDAAGRVHVVLRGTGRVATYDPASHVVEAVRDVCPMPRGIAYDPRFDSLYVACRSGALVTLPAAGGPPTRVVSLVRDLRDVVVEGGRVWVSTFRDASVLRLDDDGTIASTHSLRPSALADGETSLPAPTVAWRMTANRGDDGGVTVLHQLARSEPIASTSNAYYSDEVSCGGIIVPALTTLRPGDAPSTVRLAAGAVVVDFAQLPQGRLAAPRTDSYALAAAGSRRVFAYAALGEDDPSCAIESTSRARSTEVIAVAADEDRQVISLLRDPSVLQHGDVQIPLGGAPRVDTGHAIFHMASRPTGSVACASCHPEGTDDGHVWTFDEVGQRRTQSLEGGLSGSEPFHWNGDLADFDELAHEVFTSRMGGAALDPEHAAALLGWLDSIPSPVPVVSEPEAAERGRVLFHDDRVACASCHSGSRLTNNQTVDVGTGGPLQVPSLSGIAYRAPFMHDGCAASLADRFSDGCGGGDRHGATSNLEPPQIADLTAYLESL